MKSYSETWVCNLSCEIKLISNTRIYLVYCGRLLSQLLFCQFHLCNHLYNWGLGISHNIQHYSGVGNQFWSFTGNLLANFLLWYVTIVFTLSGNTFLSYFFIFDVRCVSCFPAYGKISGKFLQFSRESLITFCCFRHFNNSCWIILFTTFFGKSLMLQNTVFVV